MMLTTTTPPLVNRFIPVMREDDHYKRWCLGFSGCFSCFAVWLRAGDPHTTKIVSYGIMQRVDLNIEEPR